MKKLLLLIPLLLFFSGCEKDYNSVVQPSDMSYQVTSVSSFEEFTYYPADSSRAVIINFNSTQNISSVRFNVLTPEKNNLFSSPVQMVKASGNSYAAELAMSKDYVNGDYTIKYFVTDINGNTREAAIHKFRFNNGSVNQPPVIANLNIIPDTVIADQQPVITITVEASDPDGLKDIELVYFITYRPDGTTSGVQNVLSDNGLKSNTAWDETANDGVYSQRLL
jgi:hypothetical protein